jgi:hypothetical protein
MKTHGFAISYGLIQESLKAKFVEATQFDYQLLCAKSNVKRTCEPTVKSRTLELKSHVHI